MLFQSALLGLNLMANVSRSDLTVMYIHWSEPKKKIVALVAELKAHLVKQMQVRATPKLIHWQWEGICFCFCFYFYFCATFSLLESTSVCSGL